LDVDRLVQEVADLTKERFGLYHAHIYRLSQSHNVLDLVAGAGEVGRQMVADRWSIPLDREQSLVARAGRTRRGVIANDVQREPDWLPNPLLPSTRSEMAVPMIVGDQVIGVLDVQADRTDYFTEEDLRIHTTLAAQVAVALENARLFEQTQQRAAELEETTVFLDSIVENIPNMIFVKDAEELRFVRFNQAGESLIGVSRAEMIGKNDYDFFPSEEADFFVTKDREVLATGNLVDIPEETIQTLDKGTRFLHTTKVPVYGPGGQAKFLLGISEDITERKHADAERERLLAEVQRSEVRNRALLNAIPDLIIRYSKDGVHLDVKAAADFETFLPAQELIGKSVAEVMSPELARQRLAYMEQAWQSGEVQLYEHQFLRGDETTYEEIRVVPSGEDEIFVIIRDITERKREEAERERLLAEVQSAYRQYVRREWDQFLREGHRGNWRVEHKQPGLPVETGAEDLIDLKAEVKQTGQTKIVSGVVANGSETEPAVVTPISLRGEILGTLSLQDIDPERKWTDEEIALIEAVSEQLALTLENLRLFEDTKQLATREKIIADVTQEVWASGELEQVMQTAVEQLGTKLDASKVIIRLGTTDQLGPEDSANLDAEQ
jgi:PAS domain S-box-containing protein